MWFGKMSSSNCSRHAFWLSWWAVVGFPMHTGLALWHALVPCSYLYPTLVLLLSTASPP